MAFLATNRSRRPNAGANMSKLLDQEEELNEDDFYKTHYGGFNEIANDSDFDSGDSSDSENVIDSDFDIDETADLPLPEDEEDVEKALKAEERESKAKRSVYKDPKARGNTSSTASRKRVLTKKRSTPVKKEPSTSTSSSSASTPTHSSFGEPPEKKTHLSTGASTSKSTQKLSDLSDDGGVSGGGFDYRDYSGTVSRSVRKSTRNHSAAIRELLDERQRESKKRKASAKKNAAANESRPLTQKELLKEAQKTEIENTKWLENYKLIEIERVNKAKAAKTKKDVPIIRYHSYIETEELDEEEEEEMSEDLGEGTSNGEAMVKIHQKSRRKKTRSVSRTVITFPSEESFRRHFPAYKTKEEARLKTVVVTTLGTSSSSAENQLNRKYFTGPSTSAAAAAAELQNKLETPPPSQEKVEDSTKGDQDPKSKKPFSLLHSVKLPKGNGTPVSCVISGRPARYFDPLTQQPYADVSAFKVLRYYYGVYLRETFPEQKDRPEMVEFFRQHIESARRQMTVAGPRTTTVKVMLPATKVVVPGQKASGAGAHQTTTLHNNVPQPQQQVQQNTFHVRYPTTQQLQLLQTSTGRVGNLPQTITLVTGGAAGGTTTATPISLINTSGGAGSGNVILILSNSNNHRGNPIFRSAQLVQQPQQHHQQQQQATVQFAVVPQQPATKK